MATRRDFPSLMSQARRSSLRSGRGYHVCSVCRLTVEPRNSRAHARKCARLKRDDPALWLLWKMEMNDRPDRDVRRELPPVWLQQLVARGELVHGPTLRDGWLRSLK